MIMISKIDSMNILIKYELMIIVIRMISLLIKVLKNLNNFN